MNLNPAVEPRMNANEHEKWGVLVRRASHPLGEVDQTLFGAKIVLQLHAHFVFIGVHSWFNGLF